MGGANIGSQTATPTGIAGTIAGASLDPYCPSSQATNFDGNFSDPSSNLGIKVNVKSGSSSGNWGLR